MWQLAYAPAEETPEWACHSLVGSARFRRKRKAMNSKSSANAFGYASLLCSLSFWILLALRLIVPGFPKIDLSFIYWLVIWTVGLVLAFVAAAHGSKRWAWAALLPLGSFFLVTVLIHLMEPR
jgi:hypothetical protein